MILGDLGARVIKIEHPGPRRRHAAVGSAVPRRGERVLPEHQPQQGERRRSTSRRRTAARSSSRLLAQRRRGGRELPARHARRRRPRRARRCARAHPRLVYCSISGYGQTGPRRDEPGYDAVMQAEGGLMSITGAADGPPYRLGVAITDIVSGMFAAQGVLAALFARERTGEGQVVDIGMLDATTALLTYQAGNYFATGEAPGAARQPSPDHRPVRDVRHGRRRARRSPSATTSCGGGSARRRSCLTWRADPRFATNAGRLEHYAALKPRARRRLRRRGRASRVDGPAARRRRAVRRGARRSRRCSPIRRRRRARWWPRVQHATLGEVAVTGVAGQAVGARPASVRTAPPVLGQHTAAVLRELGYDQAAIDALAAAGAVRCQ